jgi:hypothetical protein
MQTPPSSEPRDGGGNSNGNSAGDSAGDNGRRNDAASDAAPSPSLPTKPNAGRPLQAPSPAEAAAAKGHVTPEDIAGWTVRDIGSTVCVEGTDQAGTLRFVGFNETTGMEVCGIEFDMASGTCDGAPNGGHRWVEHLAAR